MTTRNEIFDALVTRLKDRLVPRMVKSVVRGLDGFPPEQDGQPAIGVAAGRQRAMGSPTQPTKWIYTAHLWVAVWNASARAEQQLFDIIDAIDASLDRRPDEIIFGHEELKYQTTLGGLVLRCGIEGEIELYPAATGEQAFAIIPVDILTTG